MLNLDLVGACSVPDQSPAPGAQSSATLAFRSARDFLLAHREDYEKAYAGFEWPRLEEFNWAIDWFDQLAIEQGSVTALRIIEQDGSQTSLTFAEMAARSVQVAAWLQHLGIQRGDRILLVLGNEIPLWEIMLACIRVGAVMIPATTLLSTADLQDRIVRGAVKFVVAHSDQTEMFGADADSCTRISVGPAVPDWHDFATASTYTGRLLETGTTRADDPLLLYFTSGTTAQPKLVEHTHASYPVGHLSTMYFIGLQPGDVHLNISSPGWAKHAWSCLFAPWNAGATIVVYNYERFDADAVLDQLERAGVTTFCAPPTVWRMLIQADLASHSLSLRECVGAGEPLNPEIVEQVQRAWGLTVRDGYGQTETTAQIGNSPGQPVKTGAMGRPLPGYVIALVDPATDEAGSDGEVCIELARRPVGLMRGYRDDDAMTASAMRLGWYHTGDLATRDDDGYITYVGRSDDVFKASDYRISPFELESVLIEHPAVAEAAVVPSPDPVRLAVPKAFVTLVAGQRPSRELALDIMTYARDHLAPYKRVRRLEFTDLPKTISGKIRRVELRAGEQERSAQRSGDTAGGEPTAFTEEDFPELRSSG
jgi:acetyl-CoA synthetase